MFRYLYQPLQYKDSVRILVLHPSLNDFNHVECTLQHAQLTDRSLKYEAVSYTWGDPARTQSIAFRNSITKLAVGANCYDALLRLRHKAFDRLLWLDAICINQDDLAERNRQVRIMDRIFTLASSVVVYLGEQVVEFRALLDELTIVDDLLARGQYDGSRTPPSDLIVQQLAALYELPWCKRVWVLQEVCGKKSVNFMYGSAIVSFEALKKVHVGHRDLAVTTWPLAFNWISKPPRQDPKPQISLWKRLFMSRETLATDPRDRVFALKSLCGPGNSQLDALIDYNKSLEECYTQVATTCLLPVIGLRLLLATRHPHGLDMNSWVPDWTQNLPIDRNEALRDIAPAGELCYEIYHISSKHGRSSLELLVTGCRYAAITAKSRVFLFTSFEDAKQQMNNLYHDMENLNQFAEMNETLGGPGPVETLGEDIHDAMLLFEGKALHHYLCRFSPIPVAGMLKGPLVREFVEGFISTLQQCSIALLDTEELVIVPGSAEYGDVVTVLAGAVSTCVLRPNEEGYWTLISGDCLLFTEEFGDIGESDHFLCDEYIAYHEGEIEMFRIR